MTDYADRKGSWIITFSGKRFYPLDPRAEDIDIIDIAHSLSLINRFTGHTRFPYSVAQHSMQVAKMLGGKHGLDGLLHDASEAYVNDLARPLKRMLPDYTAVENKILDVIDQKFNVNTRHTLVKEADNRCLVTEAYQLCIGETWYFGDEWPEPFGYVVDETYWRQNKIEFLMTFKELSNDR